MLNAQPTNVWTIRNATFRAWSLAEPSTQIQFKDASGDWIGNNIRTDSNGFVYAMDSTEVLTGVFVDEPANIEFTTNGNTWLSYKISNPTPQTQIIAPNGDVLLDTIEGGFFGGDNIRPPANRVGNIIFNDIAGELPLDKIGAGIIDNSKLAPNSVGMGQIQPNSIDTSKILNGTILAEDLADKSVTEPKLDDDSVSTRTIQAEAVTLDKLDPTVLKILYSNGDWVNNPTINNNAYEVQKGTSYITFDTTDAMNGVTFNIGNLDINDQLFIGINNIQDITANHDYDIAVGTRTGMAIRRWNTTDGDDPVFYRAWGWFCRKINNNNDIVAIPIMQTHFQDDD